MMLWPTDDDYEFFGRVFVRIGKSNRADFRIATILPVCIDTGCGISGSRWYQYIQIVFNVGAGLDKRFMWSFIWA